MRSFFQLIIIVVVILAVLPLIYAVWSWKTLTLLSIFLYDDPYPVSEAGRLLLYFLVHTYPINAVIGLFLMYKNIKNKDYYKIIKSLLIAYSGIFAMIIIFGLLIILDILIA